MNPNHNLQNQLELFKTQMKQVNESLMKFELQFEQEKVEIKKLQHSFSSMIQIINHELINSMNAVDFMMSKHK